MTSADSSFRIVVLGGLGEIGMNCLAVEADGRILVIDCGVMFSSEGLGIDLIHPSFDYLADRRERIDGVILTHAHEDHISGVPYLLRELDVPIFGSAYSLGLLKEKVNEIEPAPKLVSRLLGPGGRAEIGPFDVSTFPMPHSIVENAGLVIDTPAGRILHTGDFKLQKLGPAGGQDVLDRLRQAADGRVDLMLTDSTGSEEEEIAGEESAVSEALERRVSEAPGRVFVAIFSSNARRMQSIFEIARKHGRKVALCGRSVLTHSRVAAEVGAFQLPPGLTVSLEQAAEMPRKEVLIIVSGTQGEPRSALGRLSNDTHHALKVEKEDLVILSSRFIPGNELAIGRVIDQLHRLGARVIHRGIDADIHVSGHASKGEITEAIKTVSPRCLVPVHGTFRHMSSCAELARQCGVPHVQIAGDGQAVTCDAGGLSVTDNLAPTRRIHIDGGGGLPESAIRDRRVLGAHGVLVASFSLDEAGEITSGVDVICRGVTREEALPWLAAQVGDRVRAIVARMEPEQRMDPIRRREQIRTALRKFVAKLISREPYVLVSIVNDERNDPR